MKRHAYLIMAHNNWGNLKILLQLLDKPWNFIYLHIDKKAVDFSPEILNGLLHQATIKIIKQKSVNWGDSSQVKVEMLLYKEAYKDRPYWYYHLMSGSDLPIIPSIEICKFFNNTQDNFLICNDATPYEFRLKTYLNPFNHWILPKQLKDKLNQIIEIIQYKLKVNRLVRLRQKYPKLGKGHNWCDLNERAVSLLLRSSKDISRFTRYTLCSDELYKQIILMNAKEEEIGKISQIDIRLIDWRYGDNHPTILNSELMDQFLMKSRNILIFGRKFDYNADPTFIENLFAKLKS